MRSDFPSLTISRHALTADGDYARAQADYLRPDPQLVSQLRQHLERTDAGIVAHFYMDAELQGVLTAVDSDRIVIADSLKMSEAAVTMAEAGARSIVVLGVDFMSENVRATLSAAGHHDVPVYRLSTTDIGCSLADAAASRAYGAWLDRAARSPQAFHVIYVNTSLLTKAQAQTRLPTITCTSSNVIRTILQAAAQMPQAEIFYGPDTHMGANLKRYFEQLADRDDAAITALHPEHDTASVRDLVGRFHFFQQGLCVVHDLFGRDVAARIRRDYADAFITAHLEVPGEMFDLALEHSHHGRGVVGSTADILRFVAQKVEEVVAATDGGTLRFVLGTEAGMITSIARAVQSILAAHPERELAVEIVFPVASEAVTPTDDPDLRVVPGVAAGEGCSIAGGCATCPYMKMNTIDTLFDVLTSLEQSADGLEAYMPRQTRDSIDGQSVVTLGGQTIAAMRHLGRTGEFAPQFVQAVAET